MSREAILAGIRTALGRGADAPLPRPPASARVPARVPGEPQAELALLLGEIDRLGGATRTLGRSALRDALQELAASEKVVRATLWQTPGLKALGVAELLASLGVEIVSPYAGKHALASCDLGVTGVDAALPETGTLLLRSGAEQPRMVSLLPRVHLALLHAGAVRADLAPALAEVAGAGHFVFVTGPSRTADIELTVTIGVHGPKALHVWAIEEWNP